MGAVMSNIILKSSCVDIHAMQHIASELATHLKPGYLVTFDGPLGAGKTTLIQGILKAFGYQERVTSPTFALVHEYNGLHYQDKLFQIAHFDLYRLESSQELDDLGFRDYLEPGTLCLLEWPTKAAEYLPSIDIHVDIAHCDTGRSIQATKL